MISLRCFVVFIAILIIPPFSEMSMLKTWVSRINSSSQTYLHLGVALFCQWVVSGVNLCNLLQMSPKEEALFCPSLISFLLVECRHVCRSCRGHPEPLVEFRKAGYAQPQYFLSNHYL